VVCLALKFCDRARLSVNGKMNLWASNTVREVWRRGNYLVPVGERSTIPRKVKIIR